MYAHENGCPWDKRTLSSSKNNYKNCYEYAEKNGCH